MQFLGFFNFMANSLASGHVALPCPLPFASQIQSSSLGASFLASIQI